LHYGTFPVGSAVPEGWSFRVRAFFEEKVNEEIACPCKGADSCDEGSPAAAWGPPDIGYAEADVFHEGKP
jgi:hypothetical protein